MSDEIADDAFERAYQRMMFRRNQEALRREIEGTWRLAPPRLNPREVVGGE